MGVTNFDKIELNSADGVADDLILAAGTSADPKTVVSADMKLLSFYTKSTATSGDSRGFYLRHSISGAGAGGEAVRAFTKLEAAGTTARGAQISLDVAATGSVSGLGAGIDGQLMLPNAALAANGTYAAANVEIYASGASTAVSAVTGMSFLRFSLGGNATGAAAVEDFASLFTITGGSNASGNIVGAAGNEPTWTSNTYLIRVNLNGQVAYLVAIK